MEHNSIIIEKWGGAIVKGGFTQVPHYLMYINQFLFSKDKLSPTELITLMQLVSLWWVIDRDPFPSISTLSDRVGISERQMVRVLKSLEKKGYIEKYKNEDSKTNSYKILPLVDKINGIAKNYKNAFRKPNSKTKRTISRKISSGDQ